MTDTTLQPAPGVSVRAIGLRQVRMASGLVLFVYVVCHLLNHALGNVSIDAMGAGMRYHVTIWRSLPASVVLYGAIAVHTALGLHALYARREFHRKTTELLQLVLGLSIPLLLMGHVVSIRLGDALFEHAKFYPQAFYSYWVSSPWRMWLMFAALLAAWSHGCIGLQMWLRIKPWFRPIAPLLLALAVLTPAAALLGLYQGGRTIVAESASEDWRDQNLSEFLLGKPEEQVTLDDITFWMVIGYLALIALTLIARGIRTLYERRGGMIRLNYGNGRVLRVPRGLSVLEASLRHKVPHASVCGGRARCSTCRIRVIGDVDLPPPSKREALVLARMGASRDPAVRLACQLRPPHDLSFVQIFTPSGATPSLPQATSVRSGQERFLVSLFVDMRGSTRMAESRLPFDTVFIVNRFLGAIAKAVIASGGEPNQFIGDGQLALFGLACDPPAACRQALQAAAMIAANIDELNQFLHDDLREPIAFGIGIHGGEVIVGDVGYLDHIVFTALGDSVNVAARLQDMTKTLQCEAIVSQQVCDMAGVAADSLTRHNLDIRGRAEPMPVRAAIHAHDFGKLIGNQIATVA